jgi:hypothetical protein
LDEKAKNGRTTRVARWFAFKPKIPIWEKIFRALDWKMLVYVMSIWNILRIFGVLFMTIWYTLCSLGAFFTGFGIMQQEKSGNPAIQTAAAKKSFIFIVSWTT